MENIKEAYLKQIFSNAYDAMVLIDVPTGKYVHVNPAACNRWGYSREELLQMDSHAIHPHEIDKVNIFADSVMKNGGANTNELTCRTREGLYLESETSAVLIDVESKEYIFVIVRDTSERVRDRKTIEEKNRQLELQKQEILERNLALEKINQTKNTLFTILSHDLKAPLNTIKGYLYLINNALESNLSSIKSISNQLGQTLGSTELLLANLLNWAKTESGDIVQSPEKFSLNSSVREVYQLFENTAFEKKIHLEVRLPENIELFADIYSVNTIFRNLVNNAIKFTNPNGEIIVEAKINGNNADIHFIDSGIGMSEESIQKILGPDQVVSIMGTLKESGTGLGLKICKELTEKNGGTIKVTSEIGKGSTFTVSLPIAK